MVSRKPSLYIAMWFDLEDWSLRVAGVYAKRSAAEKRVEKLGSGSVQEVVLNEPVVFTHEAERKAPR